jgi:hypothetical protein
MPKFESYFTQSTPAVSAEQPKRFSDLFETAPLVGQQPKRFSDMFEPSDALPIAMPEPAEPSLVGATVRNIPRQLVQSFEQTALLGTAVARGASAAIGADTLTGWLDGEMERIGAKLEDIASSFEGRLPEDASFWRKATNLPTVVPVAIDLGIQLLATGGIAKIAREGVEAAAKPLFMKQLPEQLLRKNALEAAEGALQAGIRSEIVDNAKDLAIRKAEKWGQGAAIGAATAFGTGMEAAGVYSEALRMGKSDWDAGWDAAQSMLATSGLNLVTAGIITGAMPYGMLHSWAQRIISASLEGGAEWVEEGLQFGIINDDMARTLEGMVQSPEILIPAILAGAALHDSAAPLVRTEHVGATVERVGAGSVRTLADLVASGREKLTPEQLAEEATQPLPEGTKLDARGKLRDARGRYAEDTRTPRVIRNLVAGTIARNLQVADYAVVLRDDGVPETIELRSQDKAGRAQLPFLSYNNAEHVGDYIIAGNKAMIPLDRVVEIGEYAENGERRALVSDEKTSKIVRGREEVLKRMKGGLTEEDMLALQAEPPGPQPERLAVSFKTAKNKTYEWFKTSEERAAGYTHLKTTEQVAEEGKKKKKQVVTEERTSDRTVFVDKDTALTLARLRADDPAAQWNFITRRAGEELQVGVVSQAIEGGEGRFAASGLPKRGLIPVELNADKIELGDPVTSIKYDVTEEQLEAEKQWQIKKNLWDRQQQIVRGFPRQPLMDSRGRLVTAPSLGATMGEELTLGDAFGALASFVEDENTQMALFDGTATPEDVVGELFAEQGLLEFKKRGRVKQVVRGAKQSEEDYESALQAYLVMVGQVRSALGTFASNAAETELGPKQVLYQMKGFHGTGKKLQGGELSVNYEVAHTGSGDMWQGWGVYISEVPEVAEYYAKLGQTAKSIEETDGAIEQFLVQNNIPHTVDSSVDVRMIMEHAHASNVSLAESISRKLVELQTNPALYGDSRLLRALLPLADKLSETVKIRNATYRHHLVVNVEQDELLDWDKPFEEQSEKVKAALQRVLRTVRQRIAWEGRTGEEIYETLWNYHYEVQRNSTPGADTHVELVETRLSAQMYTSSLLNSVGIKGNRYLTRRSKEQPGARQRYNFVIFDERLVQVEQSDILWSKGKTSKKNINETTTDKQARRRYVSAMSRWSFHANMLEAAKRLKTMNPEVAAALTTDWVYAQAEAWAAMTGRNVASYYETELGKMVVSTQRKKATADAYEAGLLQAMRRPISVDAELQEQAEAVGWVFSDKQAWIASPDRRVPIQDVRPKAVALMKLLLDFFDPNKPRPSYENTYIASVLDPNEPDTIGLQYQHGDEKEAFLSRVRELTGYMEELQLTHSQAYMRAPYAVADGMRSGEHNAVSTVIKQEILDAQQDVINAIAQKGATSELQRKLALTQVLLQPGSWTMPKALVKDQRLAGGNTAEIRTSMRTIVSHEGLHDFLGVHHNAFVDMLEEQAATTTPEKFISALANSVYGARHSAFFYTIMKQQMRDGTFFSWLRTADSDTVAHKVMTTLQEPFARAFERVLASDKSLLKESAAATTLGGRAFFTFLLALDPEYAARMVESTGDKFEQRYMFKSATDEWVYGAFLPTTKDIHFWMGADLHTFLHEHAHAWLHAIPQQERDKFGKWAHDGVYKKGQEWTREAHEKFADAMTTWAINPRAKAPEGLEGLFAGVGRYLLALDKARRASDTDPYLPMPDAKFSPLMQRVFKNLEIRFMLEGDDRELRNLAARAWAQEKAKKSEKTNTLGEEVEALRELLGGDPLTKEQYESVLERAMRAQEDPDFWEKMAEKVENGTLDVADHYATAWRMRQEREQFVAELMHVVQRRDKEGMRVVVDRWRRRRLQEHIDVFLNLRGQAGRTLLAYKLYVAEPMQVAMVSKQVHKKYGDKGLALLQKMLESPENMDEYATEIKRQELPDLKDYWYQTYYNWILSSPRTWGVNTVGTGLWAAFNQMVHRPLAAGVDKAAYWISGTDSGVGKWVGKLYYGNNDRSRQYFFTHLMPKLAVLQLGAKHGREVLTTNEINSVHGLKELDLNVRQISALQRFGFVNDKALLPRLLGSKKGAFEKFVRNYYAPFTSFPTRIMRASDMVFKTVAYEESMRDQFEREALRMHPKDRAARAAFVNGMMTELASNPRAEKFAPYRQEAELAARYSTFMDYAGQFTRHLNLLREETVPWLKMVVPFLNTHMNLLKRAAEMTPALGLLFEQQYRKDPKFIADSPGHRAADILAKQLEGMAIAWVVMAMLDDDDIVGAAPSDPKERDRFYNSGKLPYSIRYGDKYYSFEFLEPFNVPLSIFADLKKLAREKPDMDPDEFSAMLVAAATGIGGRLLKPAFLDQFTEYSSIRSEENKAKSIGRTAESVLVPFSGMLRWIKKQVNIAKHDGVYVPQETEGTLFAKMFPLYTDMIEMATGEPIVREYDTLTVWGEPMVISEHDYWKFWSAAIKEKTATQDPAELVFQDMTYYPGMPNRVVTVGRQQYKLDMEVYQQFLMGYGKQGKDAVRRLATSQGFSAMSELQKATVIEKLLGRIRDAHRKKAVAAQIRKGLPQPEEL